MEDLHTPFAHRPRKQSLSAIIERIVLEKQRQKEKAIFEQLESQTNNGGTKIEPCEMIDESIHEPRNQPNATAFPAFAEGGDCQMPEALQLPPKPLPQPVNQDEDEDLDEDDGTEKEESNIDPERLKAFNMFVRLYADEQLDRTIPISKQPKERIQTIIESCGRQFPEFGDRARKRLRTYLKACRRHKRIKETTIGEGSSLSRISRSTPSHLTSAQAEQILAQACQKETRGVKRLHMGLESTSQTVISEQLPPATSADPAPSEAISWAPASSERAFSQEAVPGGASPSGPAPHLATSAIYQADVGQLLRQLLAGRAGGPPPPTIGTSGELFFRRAPQPQLSADEAAAVRRLADGYRQSASLLRRSADELEALVLQGNL